MELAFPMPKHPAGGSLIVHAINTQLINAVYDIVFRYLGDQSLLFLYEVEHNQELIARLKEWIAECSLTVEVWKGDRWVGTGMIPPEANEVPFSKIARINGAEMQGEELRVRLTSLADVWEIDAVEIDWTASAPLKASVQPMLAACHSVTGPNRSAVQGTDNDYSLMLPGERIDMEFSGRPPSGNGKVFYFLKAGGYLYEWLPEKQAEGLPLLLASLNVDRVQTTCNLVRHRDAFLGLVFERWRAMRNR